MITFRVPRLGRRLDWHQVFGVYGRFAPYTKRTWHVFTGAALSMLAGAALGFLQPWPIKIVVDTVLSRDQVIKMHHKYPWLADFNLSKGEIALYAALAVLAIALLNSLTTYGQSYLGAKAGQLLTYRLRGDLYRHIHRLSLSYHDKARSGDLVMRLTADMTLVRNLLIPSALQVVSQFVTVAGVVIYMFWVDWQMTLAALSVTPLLFMANRSASHRIKIESRKQRRREGEIAAAAAEAVASMSVVKVHGAEAFETDRLVASDRKVLRKGLKATRIQAGLERQVEILIAVGTCLVLWLGTQKALHDKLTSGDLVLAVMYIQMIYKPVRNFSRMTGRLAKGTIAAERILEIFDIEPEDLYEPGTLKPQGIRGRLAFDRVTFGYDAGTAPVLQDVTLTIEAGERIALVGPSGAGKTTLVRLIPRLYEPQDGLILLDDFRIREMQLAHLREQIAFVLQETVLFGVSVWDNITYGLGGVAAEDVERAAKKARIHDRIMALPDGYQTILAERGRGLSGGERQRIALARAFLRECPVVILDEPDTYLDSVSKLQLWEAMLEVTENRTAICIVHDLGRLAFADRIVVLRAGRVVAIGTESELIEGCAYFRQLRARHAVEVTTGDATA